MKYYTINLGENKIDLYCSLLGKETVKVNGNIVSSKYAIFGADHNFTIIENEKKVKCRIDMGSILGLKFYKDQKPVIISKNHNFINFLIFGLVYTLLKISFG